MEHELEKNNPCMGLPPREPFDGMERTVKDHSVILEDGSTKVFEIDEIFINVYGLSAKFIICLHPFESVMIGDEPSPLFHCDLPKDPTENQKAIARQRCLELFEQYQRGDVEKIKYGNSKKN